jgi:hypothetical protein
MKAVPGLLAFLVGASLLGSPWWSSTLGRGDYPLVIVLGAVFAAIGIFAALPDSWPRLRTLSFSGFMAAFGLVCAALTFSSRHPSADGTFTIGGIAGFATAGPMPWWARLVAGFFAVICMGTAALGFWSLLRELLGHRPEGDEAARWPAHHALE